MTKIRPIDGSKQNMKQKSAFCSADSSARLTCVKPISYDCIHFGVILQ